MSATETETTQPRAFVITMAGLGSRFTKAGFKKPKFMLEANGETLFYWSMKSLQELIRPEDQIIYIALKQHDAKDFVLTETKKITGVEPVFVEIDELTDGQATTAYLALDSIADLNSEMVVYNIDTAVWRSALDWPSESVDGWLPCFQADGDMWSFAQVAQGQQVARVVEKERVSDFATIGLYYFKSAAMYKECYEAFFSDDRNMVNNEKYIAPMYNQIIAEGGNIIYSDIDVDHVWPLGTPDQLAEYGDKLRD